MTYFSIDDLEEREEREDEREEEPEKDKAVTPAKLSRSSVKFEEDEFIEMSRAKKLLYWICGLETYINKDHRKIDAGKSRKDIIDTSIDQTNLAKSICNVNAVAAIAVCGFIYGFFWKKNF